MIKSQPFLTEDDLQKLLNAPINCHASQRFLFNTIIQLLWDSGARISEVCNLTIRDFDSTQQFITFRNTKNGQDRVVPVTDRISQAFLKLIGGRRTGYIFRGRGEAPMDRVSAYRALKRRLTASDINKNIRPHSFRHRFITDKLNKGAPITAVQHFVGHSNLSTTGLYYHFVTSDLKKVLEL